MKRFEKQGDFWKLVKGVEVGKDFQFFRTRSAQFVSVELVWNWEKSKWIHLDFCHGIHQEIPFPTSDFFERAEDGSFSWLGSDESLAALVSYIGWRLYNLH